MSKVDKKISKIDGQQVLREIYNDNDESISVSSFIDSKVGAKITTAYPSSVLEVYSYYDNDVLLKTIEVEYSDSTKVNIVRVERTL